MTAANLDAVFDTLLAQDAEIDRRLDQLLRRQGLTREQFFRAAERADQVPASVGEHVRQQARECRVNELSWAELCRMTNVEKPAPPRVLIAQHWLRV